MACASGAYSMKAIADGIHYSRGQPHCYEGKTQDLTPAALGPVFPARSMLKMMIIFGVGLILIGFVTIAWGDKVVSTKGGRITAALAWKKGSAEWRKWPVGLALIYAGVVIVSKCLDINY